MHNNGIGRVVGMAVVWIGVAAGVGAPRGLAAGIEYPASGNLRLAEGTLEIWFTPTGALRPEVPAGQVFRRNLGLFNLSVPNHFGMGCYAFTQNGRHGVRISMSDALTAPGAKRKMLANVGGALGDWQTGQRAHLAFTWKGREMILYVDGEPVGHQQQLIGFSGGLAGVNLIIGAPDERPNPMILHAVRLSAIARTPEMLHASHPEADLATLLLERFDRPDAAGPLPATRPEVISSLSGVAAGQVRGPARFVADSAPGLALFPALAGEP